MQSRPDRLQIGYRTLNLNSFFFRTDSNPIDQTTTNRFRQHAVVPIQPSRISPDELQFIQNTLPTWLTEIEAKCASKYKILLR